MAQLGHKPLGNAPGVGEMAADEARVTYLGSFTQATWITKVGARMGRNTGANAVAAPVFYDMAGPTSNPTALVYSPTPKTISSFMAGNDPATGINYEWDVTGLLITAGRTLGGGVWVDTNSIAYGQTNGPYRMYYDETAPSVPNPFGTTKAQTEGAISTWMIGTSNRAPNAPGIVAPPSGGVTSDPTPDITISWSDPDESLGDQFSAYLIEVYNGANTSRLYTSGVVAASPTEKTAKRATWTVPGALAANVYTIRAYTYDAAGVQSSARQWQFTVNAGGSVTSLTMYGTVIAGTGGNGDWVINDAMPDGVNAVWTHSGGADTQTVEWWIINAVTGDTVRGPESFATVIAPGGSFTMLADPGWAGLPAGSTRYAWRVRAMDEFGSWSPAAQSNAFVVNATPTISAVTPGDGQSVSARPAVQATVNDLNDATGSHDVILDISTDDFATWTSLTMVHTGSGVYRAHLTATELPVLDTYQLRVYAGDPWGAWLRSTPQTLHYVAPPAITNVSPTDDSTVTSGTPTISATLDRTISTQRITIRAAEGSRVYHDSNDLVGTGTTVSYAVPPATLPNATDYDLTIWVRTADGLEATSTTQFRVEYPAPAVMTGVAGAAVASSIFDSPQVGIPAQYPNVALAWNAVDASTVPDEDWIGYVIYRLGGAQDMQWTIADRTQTGWLDTSPASGVGYDYYIGYLSRINDGLDTIESVLAKLSLTVTVAHTVITSEDADDPAVTIHLWTDRSRRKHTGKDYIEILGQEALDEVASPLSYSSIDIDAVVFDARDNAYTARDIVAAADALAEPVRHVTADGIVRRAPRVLNWRDPKGRSFPFSIEDIDEDDQHYRDRAMFRLRGRQVHRDVVAAGVVNVGAAVDLTGVIELTMPGPARWDDSAYRGDPYLAQYRFIEQDGALLDTAGWTARMWIVAQRGDTVPVLSSDAGEITLTTGIQSDTEASWCLQVDISEVNTALLPVGFAGWYDIELTTADGMTRTYVYGTFRAEGEATP